MARTAGPGRARGRFDDLVYEPDPLGRVGKGRWVRRDDPRAPVADNPDAAVERLRAAWRNGSLGAPDSDNPDDPDGLVELDDSVGARGRNGKLDVAKVETLLAAADAFDLKPTDGPTGNFSDRRADAIRDFQHTNGLKPDGLIEPSGETHRALQLAARRDGGLPTRQRGLPVPVDATLPADGASAPALAPVPLPARRKPTPPVKAPPRKPAPRPARRKPKPPSLVSPTSVFDIRRKDSRGEGHFGASREGGTRKHEGLDIAAKANEPITSAVDGKVVGIGYPYGDKKHGGFKSPGTFKYRSVDIMTDDGLIVRHFYVSPDAKIKIGGRVKAGQTRLGTAQDLTPRYAGINNHVHVEVRDPTVIVKTKKGEKPRTGIRRYRALDPTPMFSDLADDF